MTTTPETPPTYSVAFGSAQGVAMGITADGRVEFPGAMADDVRAQAIADAIGAIWQGRGSKASANGIVGRIDVTQDVYLYATPGVVLGANCHSNGRAVVFEPPRAAPSAPSADPVAWRLAGGWVVYPTREKALSAGSLTGFLPEPLYAAPPPAAVVSPTLDALAQAVDPDAWKDDLPVPTRADTIDFHARRQASVEAARRIRALFNGAGR